MNYPDKYQQLIDEETWSYIDKVNSSYPEDAVNASIAEQREFYDRMCEYFFAPFPAEVSKTDHTIDADDHADGVPTRLYKKNNSTPKDDAQPETSSALAPTLVYLHGGGFVVGSLTSHDDICAELCQRTGLQVLAVDYRLSPEHKHPAALNDSLTAIHHAASSGCPLILCGDSAGANLSGAAVSELRLGQSNNTPKILGQVLIYPGLGGNTHQGSYLEHEFAPMLSLADVRFYEMVRVPEKLIPTAQSLLLDANSDSLQVDDKFKSLVTQMGPLNAADFSGLPFTVAFSAECDPLYDDGPDYCNAINASGGEARFIREPGLVHGYLRARHSVTRAQESFTRIVDAINEIANRNL